MNHLSTAITTWKAKAKTLKQQTYAVYLACKDPRVPWYAKVLAFFIIGYALSPIDLIPDFIPVLGYLDDLILIPAGIKLVIGMIPPNVLTQYREEARIALERTGKPKNWYAAAVILLIWLSTFIWLTSVLLKMFKP